MLKKSFLKLMMKTMMKVLLQLVFKELFTRFQTLFLKLTSSELPTSYLQPKAVNGGTK
jgi:hypothetical protein